MPGGVRVIWNPERLHSCAEGLTPDRLAMPPVPWDGARVDGIGARNGVLHAFWGESRRPAWVVRPSGVHRADTGFEAQLRHSIGEDPAILGLFGLFAGRGCRSAPSILPPSC
jgi:hypothetical protein